MNANVEHALTVLKPTSQLANPSKNRLARNIQVLLVFFLQDLHDLALNLAQILQVMH